MVASRQTSLVAFNEQRADSAVLVFVRHVVVGDRTRADFHLALEQWVLVPVRCCFRSFGPATPVRDQADTYEGAWGLTVIFYIITSLSTLLSLSQAYNALISGVFLGILCRYRVPISHGILQFARMIRLPPHMTHD
jgi:hypothetical protein